MDALNKQRPPAAENLGKMGAPRAHSLQSAAVRTARASSSVEKQLIIERSVIVGNRDAGRMLRENPWKRR